MKVSVTVIQIIVAVILSGLILIQAKGTGLGRTFGQGTYHSKRGVEFVVFRLTILMAVVFVIVSVANQLLP
jgi:preprotein translocase subunit SecG